MKNKKTIILSVLAMFTIISLLVGATYAYFTATGSNGVEADVSVGTSKEDILTFEVGTDINIEINQTIFASGKGNASDTTFAKAILITGNEINELKISYNLYLNINENELTYTSEDNTPELLLKITDSSGVELTSISGLNYKEVIDGLGNTVKGFDITTKTGLITILNNQEIIAKPSKTDTWNVEVIFVNLDSDQTKNAGKSVNAKLILQKEKVLTLAEYIKSQYKDQGESGLYLHNGTIKSENTVIDANDNSYRYAGGDYELTEKAIDDGFTTIFSIDNTSTNELIEFYCDNEKSSANNLCESPSLWYFALKYDTEKKEYNSYQTVIKKAIDDGYIKNGSINNYVCFGSDADTCPSDNLYRIIGVFGDNVKLIKADLATSNSLGKNGGYSAEVLASDYSPYRGSNSKLSWYYWSSYSSPLSSWETSLLNTVNLNSNYLNTLGKWANMIAESSWQIGGTTYNNIIYSPMYEVYQYEIVNPSESIFYNAKIGLMYVSDYGYAASPKYWTYSTFNGDFSKSYATTIDNNWLYLGQWEWTITRISDYESGLAFRINIMGDIDYNYQIYFGNIIVRPSFYLKNSVLYASGSGTKDSPIILL